MLRLIAFLQAINVGGHNVAMAELRGLFDRFSLKEVETFMASGNVIFTSRSSDIRALQHKIESQLLRSLGYEVKAFLRTVPEVAAIARYKPFNESQLRSAAAQRSISSRSLGRRSREVTGDFPDRDRRLPRTWPRSLLAVQSDSTFSNARFEKILNGRATCRNINTVVRLAARYSRSPDEG